MGVGRAAMWRNPESSGQWAHTCGLTPRWAVGGACHCVMTPRGCSVPWSHSYLCTLPFTTCTARRRQVYSWCIDFRTGAGSDQYQAIPLEPNAKTIRSIDRIADRSGIMSKTTSDRQL